VTQEPLIDEAIRSALRQDATKSGPPRRQAIIVGAGSTHNIQAPGSRCATNTEVAGREQPHEARCVSLPIAEIPLPLSQGVGIWLSGEEYSAMRTLWLDPSG